MQTLDDIPHGSATPLPANDAPDVSAFAGLRFYLPWSMQQDTADNARRSQDQQHHHVQEQEKEGNYDEECQQYCCDHTDDDDHDIEVAEDVQKIKGAPTPVPAAIVRFGAVASVSPP